MEKTIKGFLDYAANIKPTARQLSWFNTGFYAFVHFSPNTYTDLEWGRGDENPAIFNPTDLDCDSWVEAVKAAGMKGVILTAKHHDGFCLWQTNTTMHSMKSSPFKKGKGDIVKEAAEACTRGGITRSILCSPRTSPKASASAVSSSPMSVGAANTAIFTTAPVSATKKSALSLKADTQTESNPKINFASPSPRRAARSF